MVEPATIIGHLINIIADMEKPIMNENVPDKQAYQSNRRRMCWVCLSVIVAMVAAILINPEKYGSLPAFDMAFLALSGLVAAYFGATALQNKKR